jgi:tRNA (cytidine/uridine-2'-O-)-methyltransferase
MSTDTPITVPLHVVLVHPQIPQNAGNIGRTCVALGAKLWLVRPLGFRLDEHHRRRAGLDYWQYLDWQVVDSWEQLVASLPTQRKWFFTKHGDRSYATAHFEVGDALVFGSETQGLPKSLLAPQVENALRIPMSPKARSLNLANSVAIAGYEAIRQIGGLDERLVNAKD